MTTLPVASSSRLRLDAPAPQPPPPPSTARRRRAYRRNVHMVAFVLALTAPYLVTAAPLTALARGHDPQQPRLDPQSAAAHDEDLSSRIAQTAVIGGLRLLQRTVRATATLFKREEGHREWPRISVVDDVSTLTANGPVKVGHGRYYMLIGTMSPGFIVLSYLIALVGSLCTLELLIRRTSNKGVSNLILLTFAGICFGAVSTFAMHFVGNQSLTLSFPNIPEFEGYRPLSLSYQAGYTILSLVASCLAMILSFFVMGTNIRFSEWRAWACVPGSRDHRRDMYPHGIRDDYLHWKLQKSRLRKGASVSNILQQAGMVASWPNDTAYTSRRGWKYWLFGTPPSDSPLTLEPDLDQDEDTLVKHDQELGEIDFRLGRGAVREAIDRRQTARGMSPMDSAMQSDASVAGYNPSLPDLPCSPLAAYYPTGGATREIASIPPPIDVRRPPSPTEIFAAGYQFPPRTPVDSDSTSNLIPRSEKTLPNGVSAWNEPPSTEPQGIRRGSLPPPLNPPPAPRLAQHTLSRIQSLPEMDSDGTPPMRYSIDIKEDQNQLSSGSDENAERVRMDSLPYDDDYDDITRRPGWRARLRHKVQSGLPLTPAEQLERFVGLDVVTWADIVKISLTGMLAGWGVAAMHYIGQVSITGIPYVGYHVAYVVGSVIIGSGAAIIALYIMFIMLRPKLKHSWISKIGVAVILAGAVCGMHYCAMKGTIYGWDVGRPQSPSSGTGGTKRAITGLVAALAFIACLGVTVFIMINSMRDRKERARRRRVVVTSVLLDQQDRMLVSAIDGLLPMCDIASLTSSDSKRPTSMNGSVSGDPSSTSLGVDLTTGNEAFIQAMKLSWTWRSPFWSSMNPYLSTGDFNGSPSDMLVKTPSIAGDITGPPTPTPPQISRRASAMTAAESLSSSIAVSRAGVSRFLEKFAISATQLSIRLTGQAEGISRLGVLYDHILTTGWVRLTNGKDTVSKGQLIFLVRRVNSSQERSDLLSRHFIFADSTSVATSLHKTLSTPFEHVMPLLEDMRSFCDRTTRMTLRPNTLYAGVVVVQATPFDGLRILLDHQNRSQLPMREVCTFSTLPGLPVNVADGLAGTLDEIGEAVTWLDGMNLLSVITRNMSTEATRVGGPRVGRLLAALERAIVPMLDELLSIDDMAYILPRLQLHPVLVPLTPATPPRKGMPGWAAPHIIVFYANYDITVNMFADKWVPFKLFRAQHECVMASKIGSLTRATETAPTRTPRAPSPAHSPGFSISSSVTPDPGRYNYARRPSKVQFEVPNSEPPIANYQFPPKERDSNRDSSTNGSTQGHVHPTSIYSTVNTISSIGSPSTITSFPTWSSAHRPLPRRASLARTGFRDDVVPEAPLLARAGVVQWDPNWLVNLLRTRLRAEP